MDFIYTMFYEFKLPACIIWVYEAIEYIFCPSAVPQVSVRDEQSVSKAVRHFILRDFAQPVKPGQQITRQQGQVALPGRPEEIMRSVVLSRFQLAPSMGSVWPRNRQDKCYSYVLWKIHSLRYTGEEVGRLLWSWVTNVILHDQGLLTKW